MLSCFSYILGPHRCIDLDLFELYFWLHLLIMFFSSHQDAVADNEQRKKQEEAMREKLLAQEAKQQEPKVQSKCNRAEYSNVYSELNKVNWTNILSSADPGPVPEEEAAAARADRRAAQAAGQRPPARIRGQGWHHRGHHHRWDRQYPKKTPCGGQQPR